MRSNAIRTNAKDGELMMRNADMPAMPAGSIDINAIRSDGLDESGRYLICRGLTKREMFAMAAMQGILSSLNDDFDMQPGDLARCSIANADALLAELERTK